MKNSSAHWSELEIFARGPAVVFCWRNSPGWPVEYASPNVTEVFGYTAERFIDGTVTYAEVIHPEDVDRVTSEVNEGVDRAVGTFVHTPYRIVHADGSARWLYDMAHIVYAEGSVEPTHFIGYVVDITKQIDAEVNQHALEVKLLQSQKLESLGLLASGVAHDFNNFLTGILGEIDLVRLNDGDQESNTARALTMIETLALRAAELTRLLLTYTGERKDPPQPVKLDELVREVIDMLSTVLASNASVELDLSPVEPIVADRAQITQVVMNLLTNASEALEGKPGRIGISVAEGHDPKSQRPFIRMIIEDSGCGMTKKTQSQLFDPFFTTKSNGRGLGMAAVQGILRAHGGDVTVESVLGEGTKFVICLPLKDRAACASSPRKSP